MKNTCLNLIVFLFLEGINLFIIIIYGLLPGGDLLDPPFAYGSFILESVFYTWSIISRRLL
jgi:hypothetical protein